MAVNIAARGAEHVGQITGVSLPVPALPLLLMNESYKLTAGIPTYAPTISLQDSLQDALDWYRSAGYLGAIAN